MAQISIILLTAGLVAQAKDGAASAPFMSNIVLFGILILIFWFVLLAPQKKEMKQKDAMRDSLKKGDVVVTGGGMHGEVVKTDKDTVTLRIALPKTDVVFDKQSVVRKTSSDESQLEKK